MEFNHINQEGHVVTAQETGVKIDSVVSIVNDANVHEKDYLNHQICWFLSSICITSSRTF